MSVCVRAGLRVRRARARRALACAAIIAALPLAPSHADESAAESSAEAVQSFEGVPAATPARPPAGPPAPMQRSVVVRGPASDRLRAWRGDAALVTAGQLADIVSTEIALARPGAREANPLLANRGVRIPAKLAMAGGISLGCYALRRHGRHGTARALSIASFVVGAAAAVHNARVGR
jgi:hypothetical protein